jgi:hypothetical protein
MMRTAVAAAVAIVSAVGTVSCTRSNHVQFGDATVVSAPTQVGAAPMFAIAPDGAQAIAWVSAPGGGSDGRLYVRSGDTTSVLRDSLGPIEPHGEAPPKLAYGPDGSLYALYVVGKVVPGRRFPASALRIVKSADGGRSWDAPATVTDDSMFGSHNFHALHVAHDGTVYVAWLDGRHGKSAAYITRSTDGGTTWERNRRVAEGEACPCCRTAIGTASDGTVYVAWRAVLPGSVRDIVVARSSDGGRSWSEPVRAHADDWVFEACPHAGPSLQVGGDDRVHVAWWTGKEGAAGVYYAHSTDGARSFSPAVPLGVAELSRPAHVQMALGNDDLVAVVWDDGTKQEPDIALRISRDGGARFGSAQRLSDPGRVAGFPVLAITDQGLTVAWSEQTPEGAHRHASARPDMSDPTSVMGLPTVGATQVLVRNGRLD